MSQRSGSRERSKVKNRNFEPDTECIECRTTLSCDVYDSDSQTRSCIFVHRHAITSETYKKWSIHPHAENITCSVATKCNVAIRARGNWIQNFMADHETEEVHRVQVSNGVK